MLGRSRLATSQQGLQHLDQLEAVNGATSQLEVHAHMVGDGRRGRQRFNILRVCVHAPQEVSAIAPVLERLDSASCRTSSNRDQRLGLLPNFLDSATVCRGRNGTFDKRDIVGSRFNATGSFQKMDDVHCIGQAQQFILAG